MRFSLILALVALFFGFGCRAAEVQDSVDDGECRVIAHYVRGGAEASEPVCATVCAWNSGLGDNMTGYAYAVEVPCSWTGREVFRR